MATAVAFDTLKLARRLEAAGFEHKQAADMAEAMAVAELATKADIERLASATKADLAAARAETKADIERLEASTKADLREFGTSPGSQDRSPGVQG
ncbi:MAG: hypothetical protein FD149_2356 [Rhodospirillaceae bacterium]|nr:MAG: hypothetical protein FD149_2356 [Rhodospirillaceae bacterium]